LRHQTGWLPTPPKLALSRACRASSEPVDEKPSKSLPGSVHCIAENHRTPTKVARISAGMGKRPCRTSGQSLPSWPQRTESYELRFFPWCPPRMAAHAPHQNLPLVPCEHGGNLPELLCEWRGLASHAALMRSPCAVALGLNDRSAGSPSACPALP
jgi:hypothetical protein